jgi:hypothetical protein
MTSPIMRYFTFEHLPAKLRTVFMPFGLLAAQLDGMLPDGPEKSVALRKLLEGKDAAVRSALDATELRADVPVMLPAFAEVAARIAHEVNRAYCRSIGDHSQPPWDEAPDWQRSSAIKGVQFHMDNPLASPEASHASWLAQKLAEGWKWGPVKDADRKEHPCCVPYLELPTEQRSKDYLFRAVIHALRGGAK